MGPFRHRGSIGALIGIALLVGACTGEGEVDGTVTVVGSSTLRPFMTRIAGIFVEENPRADISLDASGTGPGMFLFCDGRAPIATASRAIDAAEEELCRENGVHWVELPLALDAIVAITSDDADVECLSTADLYTLTGPEAVNVDEWSEAAPVAAALDSSTSLPDAPLEFISPPDDSGTVALFVDLVIESPAEERDQAAVLRPDHEEVESDLLVSDRVLAAPSALGILGFGPWRDSPRGARAVAVDAGDGCVAPADESVVEGRYPLSRELFAYVDPGRVEADETLSAFVELLVTPEVLETAGSAGAIALSQEAASETEARWDQAVDDG